MAREAGPIPGWGEKGGIGEKKAFSSHCIIELIE